MKSHGFDLSYVFDFILHWKFKHFTMAMKMIIGLLNINETMKNIVMNVPKHYM